MVLRNSIVWEEILFVVSGVFSTIGYQLLFYQGAGGGGLSLITVLPSYIGMIFPLLNTNTRKAFVQASHPSSTHKLIVFASTADVSGSIFTAMGLFYTGSGLYQVLYSSVVIFTALIARIFLGTPLSTKQWLAILFVNIGLGLSTGTGIFDESSNSGSLIIGTILVLMGTILVASAYVLDEKLMDEGRVTSKELCYYTGLYSTILTLLYISIYTLPRFKELVYNEVVAMNSDWAVIAFTFLACCLSSVVHNRSYFIIVDELGGVTAGILQALRAVLVFFVSALFFCSSHSEQCFSIYKAISAFVVIGGVILFIKNPVKSSSHSQEYPV